MNGFQEIKGYVMYKDIPVVRFDYNGGMLTNAKVLADKKYLPIEYKAMVFWVDSCFSHNNYLRFL